MYQFLMDDSENCTSLPVREGAYWVESFSDIPASVLSRLNLTAVKSCCNGNETESCLGLQSGTTCEPSTENRGVDSSMSCAEGFPVRTSALLEKEQELTAPEAGYGEKWHESFAKLDPFTFSWKIRQRWLFAALEPSLETWPRWGTMRGGECWDVETPVGCTNAIASGYLHLPTIGKNEYKGSSYKRFVNSEDFRGAKMSEALRTCETDPIYLDPCFAEKQMNWPVTWTELAPLAMDRFQQWLCSHGERFHHKEPVLPRAAIAKLFGDMSKELQ